MAKPSSFFNNSKIEMEKEKNDHNKRISHLLEMIDIEMCSFITKFVLDGRSLQDVMPVAHRTLFFHTMNSGSIYRQYVLAHIVFNHEMYADKSYTLEKFKEIVNVNPEAGSKVKNED